MYICVCVCVFVTVYRCFCVQRFGNSSNGGIAVFDLEIIKNKNVNHEICWEFEMHEISNDSWFGFIEPPLTNVTNWDEDLHTKACSFGLYEGSTNAYTLDYYIIYCVFVFSFIFLVFIFLFLFLVFVK